MDEPYRVGDDVTVLPSRIDVPGVGVLVVNSFVIHAAQPVLVDTGLGSDADTFLAALESVLDPTELAWIWLTHDDSDHSGNLPAVMARAPRARLATHGFSALRERTRWDLPLERVHAVAFGDRVDAGDRELLAVRPPTFDSPMSTAIFDESTATLFSVDSFGAVLPRATAALSDLTDDELAGGMVFWATFDSPWAHLADAGRFAAVLDDVRRLAPRRVLSAHLPPATGQLDRLLDIVATVPGADPFVAPSAPAFAAIVAALADAT